MTGMKSDDTALSTLPAYWQGLVGRDDHIPPSGISQNYLRRGVVTPPYDRSPDV